MIFHAVRFVGYARDRRHHGIAAGKRHQDRSLADRVAVLEVGLRCEVPRRALQVIGHGPVVLQVELLLHDRRDHRADAAQLRVAERVARSGIGEEPALRVGKAFRHADAAVAVALDPGVDRGEELRFVERNLGEEEQQRYRRLRVVGHSHRRGDPSRVATHDFEHEDLGRRLRHRRDIERRLAHRRGDVFRDRSETGTVVGDGKVVVDGLRNVHRGERIAELRGDLRHLEAGVGGIVAAVVEKVADVVRTEHVDQPLVLRAVLVEPLQLVSARAERAGRGVLQRGDRGRRLAAGVDEILGQRADDAVAPGIDLADLCTVQTRGLDDPGSARIDDRGHAAGLRVEGIAFRHGLCNSFEGMPRQEVRCRFSQARQGDRGPARSWNPSPAPASSIRARPRCRPSRGRGAPG